MQEQRLQFEARSMCFGELGGQLPIGILSPFVALIPAFTVEECATAVKIAPSLVRSGCAEICCVGERAEALHDLLDSIIEDMEAFHVVPTFHVNEDDACEYFMFAAGGAAASLFALISPYPSLVSRLLALAEGMLA